MSSQRKVHQPSSHPLILHDLFALLGLLLVLFFVLVSQEAKFLASLEHPNIIKLRGMAAAGTSGFSTLQERGYFLLLDRLQCTLEDKIDLWRDYDKSLTMDRVGKKRRYFLAERLHVAFDVCASLDYLHSLQVIYRDLKPDNIGFDIRGMFVCAALPCNPLKVSTFCAPPPPSYLTFHYSLW